MAWPKLNAWLDRPRGKVASVAEPTVTHQQVGTSGIGPTHVSPILDAAKVEAPMTWQWTNPKTGVTTSFDNEASASAAADAYQALLIPILIPPASPVPVSAPVQYTSESNVAQKIAPVILPAATPAPTPKETPVATTPVAVKPTIGQDIGNFFHKLLVDVDKGFAFVDKIEVAAQPVVGAIDAAIAPIDPPLAAAIAAGDGLINGVFSVTGSVLNTINTVGATNATVEQKMAAALPAIEQEILSDPTLAGAVKAVGGTPTKIAQFNTSLTAAAQALYLLTTAI